MTRIKPMLEQKEKPISSPANWGYFFGSVFFFISIMFASVAIFPGYSLSIGSSPFQAGLQNTVFSIVSVALRFYLGPMMDRRGLKPMMLLGVFSFATSSLLLLISPTYGMLLASRIYQSVGLAIFLPGMSALAAEMAPSGKIGTFIGGTRLSLNLALMAGPSGALMIIDRYGYESWFVVSSLIGVIAFATLSMVKAPAPKIRMEASSGSIGLFREALKDNRLYPVIIGIAFYAFIYSVVVSFSVVYIERTTPGQEAVLFFFVLGLTGAFASLTAGPLSDRFGRQKIAWPLLALAGGGAVLFSLLPVWPGLALACAVILGLGTQGSSLVFAAWLIDISKPQLRATTISIQENTIDVLFASGSLIFGLAAQGPGLSTAYLLTGIVTLAAIYPLRHKSTAGKSSQ